MIFIPKNDAMSIIGREESLQIRANPGKVTTNKVSLFRNGAKDSFTTSKLISGRKNLELIKKGENDNSLISRVSNY